MNKRVISATLVAMLAISPVCATPKEAPANDQGMAFRNPDLSPEARARDLCGRLTLEEKSLLMMNASPAIERLGIPAFNWWNEALHGVGRNGTATVFPITMGMAASFDDEMVYRVFSAVSDEARVKNNQAKRESKTGELYHNLSFWTPNINIFRDPRWGRGQETYGEDPYLTSRMGVSVVRGLQGPEGHKYSKLLACAKHFAVHSGPEWNRHEYNAENISLRDLYETYLPAFKALVQEAHVSEVMCAYNRYEGEPCCGSNRLLTQILRDEWGYRGLVTSDCWAVNDFWEGHKTSPDKTHAVSKAVLSGTDVECGDSFGSLVEGVQAGLISEKEIDISLQRILAARFRLGDFDSDDQVEWTRISDNVINCAEHQWLALQMARESMTLLQNHGKVLPLSTDEKSIVLMGPNADNSEMQWGNYNGTPQHTITALEGISKLCPAVRFIKWERNVEAQVAAVGDASTVIFVGGISPQLEGEEMPVSEPGFKGGDRTSIEIPQDQRDMLAALHKAGKKVILVTCSGSALGLVPESENADAILQAWYGGESGGQALAETLFGENNPSGKLPVTFYRNVEQLPDFQDYNMKGHTYRYFQGDPLFPFGYGLSYTTFRLGKASYANGKVRLTVTNQGKKDGTEVVQVYLRRMDDTEGPIKALRTFQRVDVKAGKTVSTVLDLPSKAFEWWDPSTNTMRVTPGKFEIYVGTSSRAEDCQKLTVTI